MGRLLKLEGITKRFPGVVALEGVEFDLFPGEIHVLFGENGAGKSTLVNVIVGKLHPEEGSYTLGGSQALALSPAETAARGVSTIYQEFSLAPTLSVIDNLFLGKEETRWGILRRNRMRARDVLASVECSVNLDAPTAGLSRAVKQQIEIAKALLNKSKVLIFDEPTASLTDIEAGKVLGLAKSLRDQGVGIIYISHRMREIRELADRVTVLRNGRKIGMLQRDEIDQDLLVEMMIGRKMEDLFPTIKPNPGETILKIDHLSTTSGGVRDVSLEVRAGEVVGLAGLVGCGKGRVGRAVFGLEGIQGGSIQVNGQHVVPKSPQQMLDMRVCYFPADRTEEGLCLNRPIHENFTICDLDLPSHSNLGILNRASLSASAQKSANRLDLLPNNITALTEFLSGGNRQKVLLGRGLTRDIDLFIYDEPTVGVDIGAKAEIYLLIKSLVENGAAVMVISSDLEEVVHISHRLYALHDGEIVAELEGDKKNKENVLRSFFGNQAGDAMWAE